MSAELTILGSSSAGNAYMLTAGEDSLLIEAGMSWAVLRPYVLKECGKLRGCLISHEHKDHAQSAANVAFYRIPLFASAGTLLAINNKEVTRMGVAMQEGNSYLAGGFKIIAFHAQHDAAEPLGFVIWHKETGPIVFATDTYYVKPRFKGVRTWLLECNYMQNMANKSLEGGSMSKAQADRLTASHMELNQTLETLKANDTTASERVILIHLSDRNSDAVRMVNAVKKATALPTIAAPAKGPMAIKL